MTDVLYRNVAGLRIADASRSGAIARLCLAAQSSEHGMDVHLANAWTIALAEMDPPFRSLLRMADMVLPDGRPLAALSGLLGKRLRQVRGPSLFEETLREGVRYRVAHFFLGGTPDDLDRIVRRASSENPGILVAGVLSPPFRSWSEDDLMDMERAVSSSGANLVWVGLGTPKQDMVAQRLARSCSVVAVAVGAAFDFYAGSKPEAPSWMRVSGIEWLFRLGTEPRRLWRRYLIGNPVFLWSVLRHHLLDTRAEQTAEVARSRSLNLD